MPNKQKPNQGNERSGKDKDERGGEGLTRGGKPGGQSGGQKQGGKDQSR